MNQHGRPDDPVQADARLMARVAAGEPSAWKGVADQEMGKILLLTKRLLLDQQEAEDVTQECFIRLWYQAPHWRAEARIGTWLYRVARNLAMDRLRRRRNRMEQEWPDTEEEQALVSPEWESPLQHRARTEQRHILETAMASLPVRCREALILVNVLGLHVAEAAHVMEIGEEALASLLARSRRRLRAMLAPWRQELLGD